MNFTQILRKFQANLKIFAGNFEKNQKNLEYIFKVMGIFYKEFSAKFLKSALMKLQVIFVKILNAFYKICEQRLRNRELQNDVHGYSVRRIQANGAFQIT